MINFSFFMAVSVLPYRGVPFTIGARD
jgi:hypothetical protein